ncbi:protein ARV1-like isoform X2 [Lineus longissimus]
MQKYTCIECGKGADELYKDFSRGIIKISHCVHCGKVVDKYVEFDNVVIFLDAILHKTQAYRHILFNVEIQSHWKLAVFFLFCDAYTKWAKHKDHVNHENNIIFYAALELSFYHMFLASIFELATFLVSLSLLLFAMNTCFKMCSQIMPVLKGVLLSNMGKLFVVPAIIWGQSNSLYYLVLTRIFIFTSNSQALRVLCQIGHLPALLIAAFINVAQLLVAWQAEIFITNTWSGSVLLLQRGSILPTPVIMDTAQNTTILNQ